MNKNLSILLLLAFTIGCAPRYIDIQKNTTSIEISIPPYYFYYDIAWISDHLIALAYSPKFASPINNKLSIYDTNSGSFTEISMPEIPSNCRLGWVVGNLALMSDGNLAFNTICVSDPLGGPQVLMEYDIKSGELRQLFDYGWMSARHFSFISKGEFVQENAVGAPMSNELYKISLSDQSKTKFVPNFLRARLPSWSSETKLIAFWGTAAYPGIAPTSLYSSEDIKRLVTAPWDLYVMDKDGNNIHEIRSLVDNSGYLSWSPSSDLLAFGGIINGVEGIWMTDSNAMAPIRIFDKNVDFDWSPDGKEIIAIETKLPDEKNDNIPVKAYILQLPDCVFAEKCK
jgi:hypothetical protein